MSDVIQDLKVLPKAKQDAVRMMAFVSARGTSGATCDECERGLGLTHQSASARFNELTGANIFVSTRTKRKTRSGKDATVHIVREGATFMDYVTSSASLLRGKKVSGLSAEDQLLLNIGRNFAVKWPKLGTVARKRLIVEAVSGLCKIAERSPG